MTPTFQQAVKRPVERSAHHLGSMYMARAKDLNPQPEDLRHLPALHGILHALNEPAAGIPQLVDFCSEIASLAGRLMHEAQRLVPDRDVETVGYALHVLGNRGLEEVLLEYLEDLTILKTDIEEEAVRKVLSSPYTTRSNNPPRGSRSPSARAQTDPIPTSKSGPPDSVR